MTCVLAGDIGGTKTVLCLYRVGDGPAGDAPMTEIHKAVHPSAATVMDSNMRSGRCRPSKT